jgi:hypothetical protein
MHRFMPKDFYLGIFGLAFAGAYYAVAEAIPRSLLADAVGAHGLPRVYAIVFAGLSLILVARAVLLRLRAKPQAAEDGGEAITRTHLMRAAGMLGIGVFYIVALPWIGYIPALAILTAATVHYQGGKVTWRTAGLAVAGAVVLWLVFVIALDIPQPPGLWPEIFAR